MKKDRFKCTFKGDCFWKDAENPEYCFLRRDTWHSCPYAKLERPLTREEQLIDEIVEKIYALLKAKGEI